VWKFVEVGVVRGFDGVVTGGQHSSGKNANHTRPKMVKKYYLGVVSPETA